MLPAGSFGKATADGYDPISARNSLIFIGLFFGGIALWVWYKRRQGTALARQLESGQIESFTG